VGPSSSSVSGETASRGRRRDGAGDNSDISGHAGTGVANAVSGAAAMGTVEVGRVGWEEDGSEDDSATGSRDSSMGLGASIESEAGAGLKDGCEAKETDRGGVASGLGRRRIDDRGASTRGALQDAFAWAIAAGVAPLRSAAWGFAPTWRSFWYVAMSPIVVATCKAVRPSAFAWETEAPASRRALIISLWRPLQAIMRALSPETVVEATRRGAASCLSSSVTINKSPL
jgi:hypothetical protein